MIVLDGFIIAVEKSDSNYDSVLEKLHDKPTAPDGYLYRLRASDLKWELVILPPEPAPEPEPEATAEDYEAALQELGVRV